MHANLNLAFAAFACLAPIASSWQLEVHNQIGFMADELLARNTRDMVKNILEPKYDGKLGLAAAWADTVRRSTHPFSYGWHFISSRDNPPDVCGLYFNRDCQKGGCVVQQIANQTSILEKCIRALPAGERSSDLKCSEALKFVAHFLGDVAQPLHTSGRAIGGNAVKVLFNGTETNLHQAWDGDILYAMAPFPNGVSSSSLEPFFANLVTRALSDSFRTPVSTWALCDFDSQRGTYCPELWAKDSNALVCDFAYGRLVNGSDLFLGTDRYAYDAMPIIEQQIAKAAWRLAGWLNTLVGRIASSQESGSERDRPSLEIQGAAVMGGAASSEQNTPSGWEL